MKQKRKIFSKFIAVFLAVITLLSMFPVMSVNAATISDNDTITLEIVDSNLSYQSGWGRPAVKMKANDKVVYCVQPEKDAPKEKTYDSSQLKQVPENGNFGKKSKQAFNKALYYSYGGTWFEKKVSAWGNKSMKDLMDGYTNINPPREKYYLITHILLSYMYSGETTSYGDHMVNYVPWSYINAAKELYNKLLEAPAAPVQLRLYYLQTGNSYQIVLLQKPQEKLKIVKQSSNTSVKYTDLTSEFTVYTDSNCTKKFGIITTGADGVGNYNNWADVPFQSYYAKETKAPTGFQKSSAVYKFKPTTEVRNGSAVYQITVPNTPLIKLQIEKSSANPDLTDGNSCYSLKGAKYGIYTDSSCSSSSYYSYIETDEDGYGRYGTATDTNTDSKDKNTVAEGKISGKSIELKSGVTYYAKEEVAPKGYKIDNTIYEFKDSGSVSSDGIRIYRAYSMTDGSQPKDKPTNDPVNLMLQKLDAITGVDNPSLAGAEFEVKFYDGLYTDVSEVENLEPLRTWVFKTDEEGILLYRNSYKVSGDSLYLMDDGTSPCLPVGTLTFKEIKAPTSGKYLINGDTFITTVTGSENDVIVKNAIKVPEVEKSSGLTIKKTSSDGVVKGIWFRVTSDNGYSTDVEITNVSGVVTLSGLDITKSDGSLIKYTVTELGLKNSDGTYSIPKRYKYEGPKTVTLVADNNVLVTFQNTATVGRLNITKTSDDGKVDNIWFSVTSSTGKVYKNTTDTNGKLTFYNLPVYDEDDNVISYKVEELGVYTDVDGETVLMVPYKYVTPAPQTVTLVNNDNPTLGLLKTVYFHNAIKTGSLQIVKESDDGIVTGMWFELTSNTGIEKKVQITDSSGTVTINDLPVYDDTAQFVQYTVTELGFYDETSDSYSLPSYYFNPSSESGLIVYRATPTSPRQVTITNHRKYGNIKIVKTSDDNYVEGLWFNVKSDNGYDVNIQTNSDGIAETGKVDILTAEGDWIIYEITELGIKNSDGTYSIPVRYETEDIPSVSFKECADDLAPNQTVTVQRGVYNKIKTSNLEVKKTSEDGKVDNITFNVTGSNGIDYGNKTSDSSGTVLYANLPVYDNDDNLIKYTVKELGEKQSDGTYKIPYRYKPPKAVTKTLSYDSTTTAVTTASIYNELKRGSVTLYKNGTDGKALAGSEWELYKSDGTRVSLVQTGNGTYQSYDNGKIVTLDTDNNGRLKVSNLKQGDYYFSEKTPPDGKMTYGRKIEFTISADSDDTLNLTYTAIDDNIVMYDTGSNGNYSIYFLGFTMLAISIVVAGVYIMNNTTKKHGRLN